MATTVTGGMNAFKNLVNADGSSKISGQTLAFINASPTMQSLVWAYEQRILEGTGQPILIWASSGAVWDSITNRVNLSDLYFSNPGEFVSVLSHELQHAVDDANIDANNNTNFADPVAGARYVGQSIAFEVRAAYTNYAVVQEIKNSLNVNVPFTGPLNLMKEIANIYTIGYDRMDSNTLIQGTFASVLAPKPSLKQWEAQFLAK